MPVFEKAVQDFLHNGASNVILQLKRSDGVPAWCRVTPAAVRDANGAILSGIGTLNDMNAAVESVMALRYRQKYDPFTGFWNMDAFCERAKNFFCAHPKKQFSIVRMDVNNFKLINAVYGIEE